MPPPPPHTHTHFLEHCSFYYKYNFQKSTVTAQILLLKSYRGRGKYCLSESVSQDQTTFSVQSDLDLRCLQKVFELCSTAECELSSGRV